MARIAAGVIQQFGRDSLQPAQFVQKLGVRWRGRRHISATVLRSARAGSDQHPRQRNAAATQFARQFKSHAAPMLWPKNA